MVGIKSAAKQILRNLSLNPLIDLYSLYSLRTTGPLQEDGWFRSYREDLPVDRNGNPIPWLTYSAIEFLAKRIHSQMSIFEYGCGASTLWWSSRIREVISCEHDENWYQQVITKIPSNVTLYHIALENEEGYSKKVADFVQRFDIIIIDGRERVNCAINSLNALKDDGLIVWDNSDREEYEEGYQFLFSKGFRKIEFIGMVPSLNLKNETGIFYRDNNCLGI